MKKELIVKGQEKQRYPFLGKTEKIKPNQASKTTVVDEEFSPFLSSMSLSVFGNKLVKLK